MEFKNRNIKIINDYTIGVNFGYVANGFITELPIENKTEFNEKGNMSLTDDGILVLNTQSHAYMFLEFIFPIIQLDNDYNLKRKIKHMEQLPIKTDLQRDYANFLIWEEKRRELFKSKKRR